MLLQFYAAQEIPRFGTKLSLSHFCVLLTPDCINLTADNKKLQCKYNHGSREYYNRIDFLNWDHYPLKRSQLKSGGRNPDGVRCRGNLVFFWDSLRLASWCSLAPWCRTCCFTDSIMLVCTVCLYLSIYAVPDVSMYVSMNIHTYIHTYIHASTHICWYTHTLVHIHLRSTTLPVHLCS